MKDDDGALFRIEVTDTTLDLISVGRSRLGIRHRQGMDLGKLDLDAPALGDPELIAAGVEEDPVKPGIETIGIAQGRQVPPASDERLLDGVLRSVWVPQDEPSRGVKPTDRGACQHSEGVMIALPRSLHEVLLHVAPRIRTAALVVSGVYWRIDDVNRSGFGHERLARAALGARRAS